MTNKIVVVGGGSATNALVSVFSQVSTEICYIVPISDNGGSTSEIIRVLGGPAIGDARSRIVRLIPRSSPLRELMAHRLAPHDEKTALEQWIGIVDGSSSLWADISRETKHIYRAFFIYIHGELLKRTNFNFRSASVGNLLLSGARVFFGSLDAASEFVLRTSNASNSTRVLACVSTQFSHHIAATLEDGSLVVGQTQISHPTEIAPDTHYDDDEESLYPFAHPNLKRSQLSFSKSHFPALPSPIKRIFYIDMYGNEVTPRCSKSVLDQIESADAVIFSAGSLYTSIIPVALTSGFGEAASRVPKRVMILNGLHDRETMGMTAGGLVTALETALCKRLITDVIYPDGGDIGGKDLPVHLRTSPANCPNGYYDLDSLGTALGRVLASV